VEFQALLGYYALLQVVISKSTKFNTLSPFYFFVWLSKFQLFFSIYVAKCVFQWNKFEVVKHIVLL